MPTNHPREQARHRNDKPPLITEDEEVRNPAPQRQLATGGTKDTKGSTDA